MHTVPSFPLTLQATIRPCRADDLDRLEWFGMFAAHRQIIADAYEAHQRGNGLMLVCEMNGFPVGQVWIRFAGQPPGSGLIWALRVLQPLQGLGLGTRLIAAAEAALLGRGCHRAEIGVEKNNPSARRLYERLGYRMDREATQGQRYAAADGNIETAVIDQWILVKPLAGELC
jgi:ribosomal protein S18 acetylase RimI-like enzyme